jgi:putative transposase
MSQQEDKLFDVSKVEEKLKNIKTLSDLTGRNGVIQEMIKSTVERILKAEQEAHLGYPPHDRTDEENSRNGYSKKTVKTTAGPIELEVPRDRKGTFEPQFIARHKTFDADLESRVTGMYARGMSVRDIGSQLEEFYGTAVSAALISKITDKVLEGAEAWQNRPLDDVYAVLFMDAIHYKIRSDGKIVNKAAYTCLGINLEGKVDVLGIWISESEGAHFWLNVMTELKGRGVEDILIACIDGLKGFPEAIEAVFPKAQVQLCIVHQIRTSLRYVASKYHKEFISDLKNVYRATTLAAAELSLEKLEEKWSARYPAAIASWRANWSHLSTYFSFPEEVRRMIYTTNAVESVHRQFRKVTKSKGSFPTDDALKKMLYLATKGMKARHKNAWAPVLGQLKIIFPDRIPALN